MPEGAPPPWLINMQRYGPPPSYPQLKIPGLNAPIPPGGSFGYRPGGWGKPRVDEEPVEKTKHCVDVAKEEEKMEEEIEEEKLGAGIQSVEALLLVSRLHMLSTFGSSRGRSLRSISYQLLVYKALVEPMYNIAQESIASEQTHCAALWRQIENIFSISNITFYAVARSQVNGNFNDVSCTVCHLVRGQKNQKIVDVTLVAEVLEAMDNVFSSQVRSYGLLY